MFSWKEYGRVRTDLARKELTERVSRFLDRIGETSVEGRGLIDVWTRQYNSFGYDVSIEATVDAVPKEGEYDITVRYEIKPNATGIILTILFWPVGLILFVSGNSAKQQMQREITRALEDLEDEFK